MALLEDCRNAGLVGIDSLTTVMSACGECSKWEEALLVSSSLDYMTVDLVAFSTLTSVFQQALNWPRALSVFFGMESASIRRDSQSYNVAIRACADVELWEKALNLLMDLEENQLQSSAITYNSALKSCALNARWEVSMALLRDVKSKSIRSDAVICATMLALEKAGQWQRALKLFSDLEDLPGPTYVYNAAMVACAQGGKWEVALQVFAEMKTWSMSTSVVSYTAAIDACGKGRRWQEALQLLSQLGSKLCINSGSQVLISDRLGIANFVTSMNMSFSKDFFGTFF